MLLAVERRIVRAVERLHPERSLIREATPISGELYSNPATDGLEGPKVKVVLLTEGLGNSANMNYYGPEAVRSMPALFEGAPCMVDHPSYSEEKDIPEGRVGKTIGYYKNVRVESVDGKLGCVAELHFDNSTEAWNAYQKARTAIHYKHEFPGTTKDYVGLSVNAYGESEERQMMVDGREATVNYVVRFVEARSCDMVTIPARGGKFVALMESIGGARLANKEARMKLKQRLEAARAAVKVAESEADEAKRKVKTAEALTELDAVLNDLSEAQQMDDDEKEKEAKAEKAKKEKADKESADMEAERTRKAAESAARGDKRTADDIEAHEMAVRHMVSESGLNEKYFDLKDLASMTLTEAKREIARTKRVHEASASDILKKIGVDAPISHQAREAAASSTDDADAGLPPTLPSLKSA